MTRDELLATLATRKARKDVITWARFVSMFAATSQATKTQLITAVNAGNAAAIFTIISDLVRAEKQAKAVSEVNAVAADDSLTVDELIDILG